jgi:acetyltransferase-like isoleucine patch superfamily enzyme
MTYQIIKIFEVLLCTIQLAIIKAVNYKSLSIQLPFVAETTPSIKIRNNGTIELKNIKARRSLRLFADGGLIQIDEGCFFNNNCSINSMINITIGKNTIFGENVKMYDHDHLFDDQFGVSKDRFKKAPISIGQNCWIGSNVIILKGVSICDNVLIGAGAIVSKSITTNGIYVQGSGALKRI